MSATIEDGRLRVLQLVWGAIIFAQLVLGVVGYLIVTPTPPPNPDLSVAWMLAGLGAVIAITSPFVIPAIARRFIAQVRATHRDEGQEPDPAALVFMPCILGLALREAAASLAFAALLISGDFLLWLLPAGLALATTAVAFPSADGFRRWLQR